MVAEILTVECSKYPANKAAFDASGAVSDGCTCNGMGSCLQSAAVGQNMQGCTAAYFCVTVVQQLAVLRQMLVMLHSDSHCN